jgi:hypothetical protein
MKSSKLHRAIQFYLTENKPVSATNGNHFVVFRDVMD